MRAFGRVAGVVALAVAAVLVSTQIDITDQATGTTRTCGSALDVITDRVDWQDWWARDLDEPDARVRDALIRSHGCPGALNTRTTWAVSRCGTAPPTISWATRMCIGVSR